MYIIDALILTIRLIPTFLTNWIDGLIAQWNDTYGDPVHSFYTGGYALEHVYPGFNLPREYVIVTRPQKLSQEGVLDFITATTIENEYLGFEKGFNEAMKELQDLLRSGLLPDYCYEIQEVNFRIYRKKNEKREDFLGRVYSTVTNLPQD